MIRRLLETDIIQHKEDPTKKQIQFWFLECRTPDLLIELTNKYPKIHREMQKKRSLLLDVRKENLKNIAIQLKDEEYEEKESDRVYWLPLRKELEKWRREMKKD